MEEIGSTKNPSHCCVVGGGPGGVMLAYLLARKGVSVTLLEAHQDFDRDFRGDSLNSSVMEVMQELGLAERLMELPHSKIHQVTLETADGPIVMNDFSKLKTRFPFILLLPQFRFLEFIVNEAKKFSNFRLVMGANVQELIREDGKIQGVVYQIPEGRREVRANLIAGADGRASRIRQLAGLPPIKTSPPMDILWFRLPQFPKDKEYANLSVRMGRGFYLAFLNRMEYWQISYVIPKGAYQKFKKNGLDMFKKSITDVVPEFQDRIDFLNSWEQVSFLSVETNRLPRWHLPGLLLIGDAAHAMSSAGGVGINCAIMDAVAASNILSNPLKAGNLTEKHLAKVQKKRMWPTRITQILQSLAQRSLIARALNPNKPFKLPLTFRIPFLRNLAARLTAFGARPVHVQD